MTSKFTAAFFLFGVIAPCLQAGDFYPLPSTNAVALNFNNGIPEGTREVIREDFQRCLSASATEIELYHSDRDPTNRMSLAGFWQSYGWLAATSRLGPDLPEKGVMSNGTFIISVPYAFATNYQHHIDSTVTYSNEIAAAYAFIASLSPTNLQNMSTNQLLSMELWKQAPPGQTPIPQKRWGKAVNIDRQTTYFPPPRVAFHVWDCGPTNNPPYLWCVVPIIDCQNDVSHRAMIYFQNQWWFTSWYYFPGEQQW